MNQRDLELLSSYLDGQLSLSDVKRLESRLKTDPQLASVLNDLRATRSLLRKLPPRRAQRNFTLTRKMVGQNPPLPRSYPFFRFATVLATLLFVFSLGANSLARQMASPAFGVGGGGGGAAQEDANQAFSAQAPAAAATQAPAATEAPAPTEAPALEPPFPTETAIPPVAGLAPYSTLEPTQSVDLSQKNGEPANATGLNPEQSRQALPGPLIPFAWQIGLAIVATIGLLSMFLIRQISARRWRNE